MKKTILLILVIGIISCRQEKGNTIGDTIPNSTELKEIYKNDQAERQTENIDWKILSKNDSLRRVRVKQLLDSNKVNTSLDYKNAAMIFQHGKDSIDYGMAVKLMRKSIELDSTANKWLLAAAIDRYLLSKDEPQIYGTQYQKTGHNEPWRIGNMDTTKISDAERKEYNVPILSEQRERVKRMNRKKLSELLTNGKTIDEIIEIIKKENKNNPIYDISESGINSFGYNLLSLEKNNEALKIFKLNTELFPNAYNTYDSYGECLLKLDDKENGIKAYKKSLELNPNNKNAENVLADLK